LGHCDEKGLPVAAAPFILVNSRPVGLGAMPSEE
jgi:hypothetical protein